MRNAYPATQPPASSSRTAVNAGISAVRWWDLWLAVTGKWLTYGDCVHWLSAARDLGSVVTQPKSPTIFCWSLNHTRHKKKQLILNESVREKGDYLCDAVSWLTEGQFVPVDHVDTHSIQVLYTSLAWGAVNRPHMLLSEHRVIFMNLPALPLQNLNHLM
jgi:hypothetical protein